ncbi:MAG: hypothetical protein M9933_02130 [Chitinophagaceae bacterium]|nr:hypothetical protein [Chitinophagaceae bacterium]
MKKIFIILLLAAGPFAVFSQSEGSHTIRIQGVSLQQLIRVFLDAGFTIEKSEGSLSTIITYPKNAPNLNVATQIKAKIKDENILLTGDYIETGKAPNSTPITDSGTPGSPCRESWNIMYTLAQSFNKPVEIL